MRRLKPTEMTFHKTCPECEADVTVHYYPGNPSVTGGGPDDWYPGDPDGIDCDPECVVCLHEFSQATLDRWIEECAEECNEYCEPPERDRYDEEFD